MSLVMKDYRNRLIDDKITRYLNIFGAISIQGPKWCGKTWTSLNHANSVVYMTEKGPRDLAKVDPKYIFKKARGGIDRHNVFLALVAYIHVAPEDHICCKNNIQIPEYGEKIVDVRSNHRPGKGA